MKSKVYVKIDSQNHIVRCDGGYTIGNIANVDDWILIDEGYGDKYNLCQSNYFDKPLITEGGAYQYVLIDGKPVECTEEEITEQEEANNIPITNPSTLEDRVSTLEKKVDKTIAEYEESLIELGVEV